MVQLNRSMMERYEIPDRRPAGATAVLFGADRLMLGGCARLLDMAQVGAVCVTREAEALRAQDGMFTLLVRGEDASGEKIDREAVIQSIVSAVNPETEFDDFLKIAESKPELVICHEHPDDVEIALLARLLFACETHLPLLLTATEQFDPSSAECLKNALVLMGAAWGDGERLQRVEIRALLCDSLSAPLDAAEQARAKEKMNYRDDFIAWAEPYAAFAVENAAPEALQSVCTADFAKMSLLKARVFDAALFLCTSIGYLCGLDSFAEVLKDEALRGWIGGAFYEELLPYLPDGKEAAIISTFERLENPLNRMPLLSIGQNLLSSFAESLLPSMRRYADEHFEAPPRLSLGLAAAIMLYAGARPDEKGRYCVARENKTEAIHDRPEVLEAFSRLSHDMPAESLAYAALADRGIWGEDLRELDGLEMRVSYDLSSIQRIGLRETLRIKSTA